MMGMYNNWDTDLKASTKAILSIKDIVLPKLISGKLYSIEDKKDEVLILMDQKSGVDFLREDDIGLQGIAARVQWGNDWNTFTIRKERHTGTKTELAKRLEQINKGYFFPAFTMQSYFDNRNTNSLLSIAMIKTIDLYNFIINNPNKCYENKSDNKFIYIRWSDVINKIKHYPKNIDL